MLVHRGLLSGWQPLLQYLSQFVWHDLHPHLFVEVVPHKLGSYEPS